MPVPGRNNKKGDFVINDDGSVTLSFGPEVPARNESNWIQIVPGKS